MLNKGLIKRIESFAIAVSILGALFKIMHWPGANIMLIVGLCSVSTCHFALITILQSSGKAKWTNYLKHYSIAALVLGYLFKVMHWPGAYIMLMGGGFGFAFSFVVSMLGPDESEDTNNNP